MRASRTNRSLNISYATILAGIVALFLSACGNTSEFPTIPPPDTLPPATATPYVDRRPTLPPSWTPTDTPTHTRTPTVTNTPTATATYTTEQICEGLVVSLLILDTVFVPSDALPFFFMSDYPDLQLVFTITHLESQQEEIISLPGSQPILGQLHLDFDAGPGSYELTIRANTADHTGLCERQVRFTVEPEPPAEATPEITAELITQTPIMVIVTATPNVATTVFSATPELEVTSEPTS